MEAKMHLVFAVRRCVLVLLAVGAVLSFTPEATAVESGAAAPHPVVVTLDPATKDYARVLGGPPATHSMRSGYVVLGPGKSVGKHSTEGYEEVVVVFEGTGTMTITGGPELSLGQGSVAYCPPQTEHDVTNVGQGTLRYLYVVASVPSKAKE
jgi:quercetin dioxygenase-like cupin family protein